MNTENAFVQLLSKALEGTEAGAGGIGMIIVNLAEDISKFLPIAFFVSSVIGFFLFCSAIYEMRKSKEERRKSSSSIALKFIACAGMGQVATWTHNLTKSLTLIASPMYPETYIAQARQVQSSDQFVAMLLGVFAIITFFGWMYSIKAWFILRSVPNKDDKEHQFMKAVNTALGSLILLNAGFFAMELAISATGKMVSLGNFN